jgi:hypothetical protein
MKSQNLTMQYAQNENLDDNYSQKIPMISMAMT